jgi:outer membrane lipoprotein carrier protein
MKNPLFASALAVALAASASLISGDGRAQPATPASSGSAPASPPPGAPPAQVNEAVAKVQAFYNQTTSFQSDFEQEFVVKIHNTKKTSRGHVIFAKPGKMSWTYDDPQGNRVVSDGTLLRVYEASNKQMFEQTVDKSQYPAALGFLTGQGKLADTFNFELYKGETMNFPGGFVLFGTPKVPTPAYQKVLFYVDAQTSQVRRVMVVDGQGNKNRFDFKNPRVNEPIAPNQFVFTPPAGTSVVRP